MTSILNEKKYSRKKAKQEIEHQINPKELMEAIESIAHSKDMPVSELVDLLKQNIEEVVKRKITGKESNVTVDLDKGNLSIYHVLELVDEYSDNFHFEIDKIDFEDFKSKNENYLIQDGKLLIPVEFKFDRKIFEDLRNVTKSTISFNAKLNAFEKEEFYLTKPFVGTITNIRKGQMFVSYKDIEFILPFSEFESKEQRALYEIGSKITVVFDYKEINNKSIKLFVSKKVKKILISLFGKIDHSHSFKILDVIKAGNYYKILIQNEGFINFKVLANLIHREPLVRNLRKELGLQEYQFKYILSNSADEFLIKYSNVKVEKIIIDGENYDLVVSTQEDKSKILRNIKTIVYVLKQHFKMGNITVSTAEEYAEKEQKHKESVITVLMSSLPINENDANLLYNDMFETLDVIAFSNPEEFDNIKEHLSISVEQLQDAAKAVYL